jgi:DNA-binding MarR family transcriptional regulator
MDDARVSWATLTDAGLVRLRDASPVHLRGVDTHFLAQIPDEDREALVRALETVVRGLRTRGTPPAMDAAASATPTA